jgi:hypothetical protein
MTEGVAKVAYGEGAILRLAAGQDYMPSPLTPHTRRYFSSSSSSFLFKLTMSQMSLLLKHPGKSGYR